MSYKGTSKYIGKFSSGDVFGKWTILTGNVVLKREAMIECRCECGTVKLVAAYTLVKGTSTSCKICQNNSTGKDNPNWKGGTFIPGSLITRIKRQARDRNIKFNIKMKDLEELFLNQSGRCALTNQFISFEDNTASLDRIDSLKDYIPENVQWIHKDINIMKNKYPSKYFIEMCKLVTENNDV